MLILKRFSLPLLLTLSMVMVGIPRAAYTHTIAYIGPDGNVYLTRPGETVPLAITTDADAQSPLDRAVYLAMGDLNPHPRPAHVYCCVRWSPDAAQFTFVDLVTKQLWVAAFDQDPRLLASGVTPLAPASAWSPDGTQIAYLAGDEPTLDYSPGREIRIIPADGGEGRTIAAVNTGCERDGPGPELAGYILDFERGRVGFYKPLSLDWTPWGLLYGAADPCQGIALVSPDGTNLWHNDSLIQVVLSPDQTRAIAYAAADGLDPEVVLVETASGQTTRLPLTTSFDLLGWNADGQTILYATYNPMYQTLNSGPADDPLNQHPALWQATTNRVTLWQRQLDGSAAKILFTAPGYGIGTLSTSPDGDALTFSLVTSAEAMLQAKNAGSPPSEWEKLLPHTEVVLVWLNGDRPVWIGTGGQPAFGQAR